MTMLIVPDAAVKAARRGVDPAPGATAKPSSLCALLLACAVLSGCSGDQQTPPSGSATLTPSAASELVGSPFLVTIPGQPIASARRNARSSAYRLAERPKFERPVTLAVKSVDGQLASMATDALGVAYQSPKQYWHPIGNPVFDGTARMVAATDNPTAERAPLHSYNLIPVEATVKVGRTVELTFMWCAEPTSVEPHPQEVFRGGMSCVPLRTGRDLAGISEWAVNGVRGGSASLGTISGDKTTATYTAPAKKPKPATVTVSGATSYKDPEGMIYKRLLLSDITISERIRYKGTRDFNWNGSGQSGSGTADVTWTEEEDNAERRFYIGTGTISGEVTLSGCETARAMLSLKSGVGASSMGVLTAQHPTEPETYEFGVQAEGKINLKCGTQTIPTPAGALLRFDLAKWCPKPKYTDEDALSGTCNVDNAHAKWDFTAR